MTKQSFKLTTAILALVSVSLFVYSCIKQDAMNDSKTELNANFKLSEARSLFESTAKDLRPVDFTKSQNDKPATKAVNLAENIIPDWSKATVYSTPRSVLYEIPLNSGFRLGGRLYSKIDGEMISKKVTAVMRLVVEKFNETDSTRYYLVTIVGSDKDSKNTEPFSYMGNRTNFEGYMIISSVEGEPLRSYYYKDGKRRHSHLQGGVREKAGSDYVGFSLYSQGTPTKSGSYTTGENGEYCYTCHQLVSFSKGVCSNCGADPIEIGGGYEYYFCSECGLLVENCTCPSSCAYCGEYPCTCSVACQYCGDPFCNGECQYYTFCTNCGTELINGTCPYCNGGTGEGDGNITGGGSPDSTKYSSSSNDKFFNKNIQTTMLPQLSNTCVTSIMEYINHNLCDGQINEGDYHLDYLQRFGIIIAQEGVLLSNIYAFVSNHFNLGGYTTFKDAIDNGNVVMTDMVSAVPGSSHNVAVVGYKQSGELIYMDPELGYLREANSSAFLKNYFISIQSCK